MIPGGGGGAASKSTLSVASPSVVKGHSVSATLTTYDSYSNANPTGITTEALTLSSGTGKGTFGTLTSLGNGVFTSTFTGTTPGACVISASVNGSSLTSHPLPDRGSALHCVAFFQGGSSDGSTPPYGTPSLSEDGAMLYGMTFLGGSANRGSLFSLPLGTASSSSVRYLHFFPSGSNYGAGANEALLVSNDGSTLSSMTKNGGPTDNSTLLSIPVSGGSPSYLYFFAGGSRDGARTLRRSHLF